MALSASLCGLELSHEILPRLSWALWTRSWRSIAATRLRMPAPLASSARMRMKALTRSMLDLGGLKAIDDIGRLQCPMFGEGKGEKFPMPASSGL